MRSGAAAASQKSLGLLETVARGFIFTRRFSCFGQNAFLSQALKNALKVNPKQIPAFHEMLTTPEPGNTVCTTTIVTTAAGGINNGKAWLWCSDPDQHCHLLMWILLLLNVNYSLTVVMGVGRIFSRGGNSGETSFHAHENKTTFFAAFNSKMYNFKFQEEDKAPPLSDAHDVVVALRMPGVLF